MNDIIGQKINDNLKCSGSCSNETCTCGKSTYVPITNFNLHDVMARGIVDLTFRSECLPLVSLFSSEEDEIKYEAEQLIAKAVMLGIVFRIYTETDKPLAMGNTKMVVKDVRKKNYR